MSSNMPTYRADIDVANDNKTRKKRNIILSVLAVLCLIGTLGYFQTKYYLLDGMPNLPDKTTMWEMNLKPNMTLLDKDGRVIGHRGPLVGEPLKLADMPDYLSGAFLAIEDERFYEHAGIDQKAILRAVFANTKSGNKGQGGSTLTQQLVKTMILTPEKTYRRKFQEALLARDMEAILSKPEILELYLNRISLGPQIFGVEAAAQRYFGKSARDVNLSESAMLAALPKAPSRFNPISNFDGAWERAELVLQRMVVNEMVSYNAMQAALKAPPVLVEDTKPLIEPDVLGYAFDMISEQAHGLIGTNHKDLIVKTTLDTTLQNKAHDSISSVVGKFEKTKRVSEGALVSIDNQTGAIRAMVGGRDYNASKFNRAAQAKRQPGSAFKAFVYAAALEDGFTPGTIRKDEPTEIGDWAPENYTQRYRGPMTLREALKLSINTIAAQVTAEIGPPRVANLATRFGITTEMRPEYSIALGSSETTLLDMTASYMVFANEGLSRQPYFVESITDTAKKTLYTRRNVSPVRAYPVPYARQMTSMLRDVIDSGTGHGAQLGSRQAAGKTGTSQDYRDAWFLGFTADYTTGVWMGNDDNSPMRKITGGLLPVDSWKRYMIAAHKGVKRKPISAPDPLIEDPQIKSQIAFYAELEEAFTTERDIASGAKTANSGGGRTAGR